MSDKVKYSFWIVLLHVYVFLFSGSPFWRAITAGAISVAVFSLFAWSGLAVVWVVFTVGMAILKLVLTKL